MAAGAGAADNTAAPLIVAVEETTIALGAPVELTILNRSESVVVLTDQHALCTVVTLERQVGDVWRPWTACASTAPPRSLTLAPRAALRVVLPTSAANGPAALAAGRYRVTVGYGVEETGVRAQAALSPTILVQ